METDQPLGKIEKIAGEDIKTRIAEKVRENSENLSKLTGVDSLGTLMSDAKPEEIEANLAEMANNDGYRDIKSVVASTGAIYLYSETYITKHYADILVRVEANDPCATIAGMVRDESRIYPRPTNIEFFKEQVFNIAPDEIETNIARMLEREEFKDIKLLTASTGARYLYSDLYMEEDYARSLVEWEEVEREENP